MRKLMLLSLALFISGCGTVRIPDFPNYPDILGEECPVNLIMVPEGEKKGSVMTQIVVANYGEYHKCAEKVKMWIEWHKEQKKIYEDIKK